MMRYILILSVLLQAIMPFKAFSVENTDQVALYYSHRCPHSQKVLAYLKESNIDITLRNVLKDPAAKQELQEYGGYMIVPCLVVNGKAIYDASDIIAWLSIHQGDLTKSSN